MNMLQRKQLAVAAFSLLTISIPIWERSADAVCTPLGTTTPNVGLCKPDNGEPGWTNGVNANWDLLDNRTVPPGTVMFYGGATPPNGWYACDGSAKNRTTDAPLFTAISITYGAGDGSTTFNIPDARSRGLIGAGQGTGLTNRALAAKGGEENHTLSVTEMPSHNHGSVIGQLNEYTLNVEGVNKMSGDPAVTGSTGGDASHNVMDPFLVLTCMIKR